jgi:hypothetical protein
VAANGVGCWLAAAGEGRERVRRRRRRGVGLGTNEGTGRRRLGGVRLAVEVGSLGGPDANLRIWRWKWALSS